MPELQGKLLPVGDVFSPEGVALAVKRPAPHLPHPLLRHLTLSVAEATRTDYSAFQVALDSCNGGGRVVWRGGARVGGRASGWLGAEMDGRWLAGWLRSGSSASD